MADTLKVAVVSREAAKLAESVADPGTEVVEYDVPRCPENWGAVLVREWVADRLEMDLLSDEPDALVFDATNPAEMAGIITAAVRLNLLTVCVVPPTTVFSAAVAALGFTPLSPGADVAEIVHDSIRERGLRARRMVDSFSLANALRVALSLGTGAETFVHLAAIGREAEVVGFPRMARVLAPETPSVTQPGSAWYREHGLPGILSHLGDTLRDARTVCGPLRSFAPEGIEAPEEEFHHEFIKARSSGAEVLCRFPVGTDAASGKCRVYDSESSAIEGLKKLISEDEAEAPETTDDSDERIVIVVRGSGGSGYPGMGILRELSGAIETLGLPERVSVLTDGLAPDGAHGAWASMFSPEATDGGVIGRLTNGDLIRIDLVESRILTSVTTEDFSKRRTFRKPNQKKLPAYAKRYAKNNLPPADGATFGQV